MATSIPLFVFHELNNLSSLKNMGQPGGSGGSSAMLLTPKSLGDWLTNHQRLTASTRGRARLIIAPWARALCPSQLDCVLHI